MRIAFNGKQQEVIYDAVYQLQQDLLSEYEDCMKKLEIERREMALIDLEAINRSMGYSARIRENAEQISVCMKILEKLEK